MIVSKEYLEKKEKWQKKNKEHIVVYKSNELVRKYRNRFNFSQSRLFSYICMLANKSVITEDGEIEITFNIPHYMSDCDITDNGRTRKNIKDDIQWLSDNSIWYRVNSHTEKLVRLYNEPFIDVQTGKVELKISKEFAPLVNGLSKNYLSYEIENILGLKKLYSIPLYEICKSYAYIDKKAHNKYEEIDVSNEYINGIRKVFTFTMSVKELKEIFYVSDDKTCGKNIAHFFSYVIDVAIKDINEKTDIVIEYVREKVGVGEYNVTFFVCYKDEENLKRKQEKLAELEESEEVEE